ncbi:hypothetical protein SCHPADRAFT_896928 [Schizopora paradoxa]|uniref:Uncharacterized protein n=1 Tax=Schizopora paradoxa TaxID=27342 RepID=A0A0H2RIA8_9AGAM|nr:hypothetical protein SCHPADRAFT_896928 [Schizopora paradoxa]
MLAAPLCSTRSKHAASELLEDLPLKKARKSTETAKVAKQRAAIIDNWGTVAPTDKEWKKMKTYKWFKNEKADDAKLQASQVSDGGADNSSSRKSEECDDKTAVNSSSNQDTPAKQQMNEETLFVPTVIIPSDDDKRNRKKVDEPEDESFIVIGIKDLSEAD